MPLSGPSTCLCTCALLVIQRFPGDWRVIVPSCKGHIVPMDTVSDISDSSDFQSLGVLDGVGAVAAPVLLMMRQSLSFI